MPPPPPPPPDAADKPLVLLAQPLFPTLAAALESRYRLVLTADADAATAASARVLLVPGLVPVTADLLARFPALELVAATSVGLDHIDLPACRSRRGGAGEGIAVTNAGNAFSVDSADYAVGLVLSVLRRIAASDSLLRRRRRRRRLASDSDSISDEPYPPLGTRVSGKRVGILGLGSIGALVARRLAAFGCRIAYCSRSPKPPSPSCPTSYEFFATARELAAASEVLVLSCALTEETRGVVNREVMEALGEGGGGVLVNVGRGGLVDEAELVRCLREGVIAGAGLDVFQDEPEVPPELREMDSVVVLSPHRAVLTAESMRGVAEVVAGNLRAFFAGEPLISPVTL